MVLFSSLSSFFHNPSLLESGGVATASSDAQELHTTTNVFAGAAKTKMNSSSSSFLANAPEQESSTAGAASSSSGGGAGKKKRKGHSTSSKIASSSSSKLGGRGGKKHHGSGGGHHDKALKQTVDNQKDEKTSTRAGATEEADADRDHHGSSGAGADTDTVEQQDISSSLDAARKSQVRENLGKLLDSLDTRSLSREDLKRVLAAGERIAQREDVLTTLSQSDTWRDIHDLFQTNSPDLKDPDVIRDLQLLAGESKVAGEMFHEAHEAVGNILAKLHLSPEETSAYLDDVKYASTALLGEHAQENMDLVQKFL
ncbi:unnamed protein product [Amoebophrya sp. A25]|nr:unnamed protein product [Amoebophrya sp. A25]|eukprot:GSA25T00001636001.1